MGKDQELIQAVKDGDLAAIQKILQKLSKGSKTSKLLLVILVISLV
jgi:hypothetical protein